MDRIRKALDLARLEREQNTEGESPSRPSNSQAREPRAANFDGAADWPTPIVYTKTQTFMPAEAELEAHRIVDPSGDSAAAAAFRMLRTQIVQRMDENGWRTVAVLSPGAEDGKTTTAINLAMNLANDRRHTVLLVDCDLRCPGVGNAFGIRPERGVDDLLRGDARVEQCLYHPAGFERLVILPARDKLANSSEALSGPQGRGLVADLRGRYPERIIIFDLPPVLESDDALAFLPLLECGLVVITERATRRDNLLRCMELLRKTPILGTVLNKAGARKSAYG